jgi:hypothetical protein
MKSIFKAAINNFTALLWNWFCELESVKVHFGSSPNSWTTPDHEISEIFTRYRTSWSRTKAVDLYSENILLEPRLRHWSSSLKYFHGIPYFLQSRYRDSSIIWWHTFQFIIRLSSYHPTLFIWLLKASLNNPRNETLLVRRTDRRYRILLVLGFLRMLLRAL